MFKSILFVVIYLLIICTDTGCEADDSIVTHDTPRNSTYQNRTIASPIIRTTSITKSSVNSSSRQEQLDTKFKAAIEQRLLPDYTMCGIQHTDDRVFNSTITALDEFPWLVDVRFSHEEYESQYTDRCSGVLINKRYVLTDAYCGVRSIKVKLGQYNTNQLVSCDLLSIIEDCTEPVQDIAVEEIVRDDRKSNALYDFVLLRLSKNVQYSNFIRPICLPIDQSKRPNLTTLVLSGWGAPNSTGVAKKRLIYNIVNDQVCYNHEKSLEDTVKFANVSFICTSPPMQQTTLACSGDHGGPFMYPTSGLRWNAEGVIISVMQNKNEENSCNDKYPINGIRITEDTIDWILSSIRP